MKEFKIGDKVYFPLKTTKICTITENYANTYTLSVDLQRTLGVCTTSGEVVANSGISNIFHATQENKDLLEKLHGVEFEAAPPKTRTVTFERPAPFVPHHGEHYWVVNSLVPNGVVKFLNFNSTADLNAIGNGVWRTKEEALMVANAIFNIEKDS